MSEWTAFWTLGDQPPEAVPLSGVAVGHDVLLAGKGKAVRVLEVADADGAAAAAGVLGGSTVQLSCCLDRYMPDDEAGPSSWSGLIYPLKAGTEDVVAKIFAESGRPDHAVKDDDGAVVGRLLRTLVFVGPELAIRVIEVDGDLRTVSRHMSRQPQVRAFEREIEQHLAVGRDMVTPEGAEQFFRDAGMRPVRVERGDL